MDETRRIRRRAGRLVRRALRLRLRHDPPPHRGAVRRGRAGRAAHRGGLRGPVARQRCPPRAAARRGRPGPGSRGKPLPAHPLVRPEGLVDGRRQAGGSGVRPPAPAGRRLGRLPRRRRPDLPADAPPAAALRGRGLRLARAGRGHGVHPRVRRALGGLGPARGLRLPPVPRLVRGGRPEGVSGPAGRRRPDVSGDPRRRAGPEARRRAGRDVERLAGGNPDRAVRGVRLPRPGRDAGGAAAHRSRLPVPAGRPRAAAEDLPSAPERPRGVVGGSGRGGAAGRRRRSLQGDPRLPFGGPTLPASFGAAARAVSGYGGPGRPASTPRRGGRAPRGRAGREPPGSRAWRPRPRPWRCGRPRC